MPVMRATNAPSTTGTWYVGVCESSRHDWPNPAPDFARVDSMVLSPPRPHPPMPGHSPIGTPIEPRVPTDKRADAGPATIDSSPAEITRNFIGTRTPRGDCTSVYEIMESRIRVGPRFENERGPGLVTDRGSVRTPHTASPGTGTSRGTANPLSSRPSVVLPRRPA